MENTFPTRLNEASNEPAKPIYYTEVEGGNWVNISKFKDGSPLNAILYDNEEIYDTILQCKDIDPWRKAAIGGYHFID